MSEFVGLSCGQRKEVEIFEFCFVGMEWMIDTNFGYRNMIFFFELYAFIILTSTLVLLLAVGMRFVVSGATLVPL